MFFVGFCFFLGGAAHCVLRALHGDWIHNQADIEEALAAMQLAVEEAGIPRDAEPLKLSEEFGIRVDELLSR